jgi:hypothetical protein
MRKSIRLVVGVPPMAEKVQVLKLFEHAENIVFISEVFGVYTD